MQQLSEQELDDKQAVYYIPHHAIWQRKDGGKKLRVVFNASRPTCSGKSLNDIMYAGPKLQNNIPTINVRWRMLKIVFCADVKMMYRGWHKKK